MNCQNTDKNHIHDTITLVESLLATYYEFTAQASAIDHLLSENDLSMLAGASASKVAAMKVYERAGVFCSESLEMPKKNSTSEEDFFIGIYFSKEILTVIQEAKPHRNLNHLNLDAFSVIVEEVSHFHLILNRAVKGLSVSGLELEWQAEIDKILIPGLLLLSQSGDPHISALIQIVFETSVLNSSGNSLDQSSIHASRANNITENVGFSLDQRYKDSSKLAEVFWRDVLRSGVGGRNMLMCHSLRQVMQQNYRRPMSHKSLLSTKNNSLIAA